MARKSKEVTWGMFFGALSNLIGIIFGLVAKGFFWGIGFWWAFYELMK